MAERQRAAELRVGAFVLGSTLILGLGILWVIGYLPLGGEANEYNVLMGSAAGIRAGDRVRVSGIELGRVESVTLRPGEQWPVVFAVTLSTSIRVTEEASAYITSDGLLSANYLQIAPGPPGALPLPSGGTITGTAGGGLMAALEGLDDLSAQTSSLLEQLESLVHNLSVSVEPLMARLELLLSDKNLENFSGTLVAFRKLAEETGPRTNTLLENLDTLVTQLGEGTETLPELAADLQKLLTTLNSALGSEGSRLADLLDSAQSTLDSAGVTLEVTAQNRRSFELALRDLEATMANLKSFTATLEQRPSALLRKNRRPDRKPGEGNP